MPHRDVDILGEEETPEPGRRYGVPLFIHCGMDWLWLGAEAWQRTDEGPDVETGAGDEIDPTGRSPNRPSSGTPPAPQTTSSSTPWVTARSSPPTGSRGRSRRLRIGGLVRSAHHPLWHDCHGLSGLRRSHTTVCESSSVRGSMEGTGWGAGAGSRRG